MLNSQEVFLGGARDICSLIQDAGFLHRVHLLQVGPVVTSLGEPCSVEFLLTALGLTLRIAV